MNIASIMTRDVHVIGPADSLQSAAMLMDELDVGSLPVSDGLRLMGIITDRDITVRGTALGVPPTEGRVADVMTPHVESCRADDDVQEVMRRMGDSQIRRLPVTDDSGRLVGIVSLSDLAVKQSHHIDSLVREISVPTGLH